MPPLTIPTAASNGFGGHHVAYTDNVFGLLVNPAAIIRVEQRSFFTLAPTLYSPQFVNDMRKAIGDLMSDGSDNFAGILGNMADTLSKQRGRIALGLELREFPLSIAWVADGFGFGLWNTSSVRANIIGTNVGFSIMEDVMLPVGMAFKILDLGEHTVDAGFTVKPFGRFMIRQTLDIMGLITDSERDLTELFSMPVMAGAGFDLGFMYRWDMGLQAGLTFNDIFTRGNVIFDMSELVSSENRRPNTYEVPFTMNLGLAYDFRIGRFWPQTSGLVRNLGFTLAVDWRNIANIFQQNNYMNRNALLDFGVGFQVSIFDIGYVRIGMNEMLPAAGIGVDLGPFKIDLAYYGREFGNEPGQLSVAAVDLSIALRPGAKKRDWIWARRSLFGIEKRADEMSWENDEFWEGE
jgi:hypothetical protein